MPYDSPKQIRRRQLDAGNKASRRRARAQWERRILTDEEWEATCDRVVSALNQCLSEDFAQGAGRLAQAIVHSALQRRAYQIMRDFRRAYWKAMEMARHELYNCEV